jgi:uncharacterized coiled-coil protein SlyX
MGRPIVALEKRIAELEKKVPTQPVMITVIKSFYANSFIDRDLVHKYTHDNP